MLTPRDDMGNIGLQMPAMALMLGRNSEAPMDHEQKTYNKKKADIEVTSLVKCLSSNCTFRSGMASLGTVCQCGTKSKYACV